MTGVVGLPAPPISRSEPFVPAPEYEEWREQHPLKRVQLPNGQQPWIVLRRDEAQAILAQSDHLSSDGNMPGFPMFRAGASTGSATTMLVRMDPPLHSKFRKLFAPFFTAKRINAWRPELARITAEAIDTMLANGSPADFYRDVALVISSKTICLLLGVDYELHTEFERLTRPVASALVSAEERNAATAELYQLMNGILEEQSRTPREGVVAKLLALVDRGEITYDAALANAFLLLIGGHETSAHTISLGAMQMMERPDLQQAVAADPGKLPILVEEMLRTQAVAESVVTRAVTKPIQVGDTVIQAGEGIAVPSSSANHDPRAFPNPHEIDLDRDLSGGHLAFGAGIHACLGQSLARAELEAVFGTLFQRVPTLRLVEDDPVEFQRDPFIFGVRRMPVAW